MIVEGRGKLEVNHEHLPKTKNKKTQMNKHAEDLGSLIPQILSSFSAHRRPGALSKDSSPKSFAERLNLTVVTLSQLLKERPTQAPLASAFLLHAVLFTYVPLSKRRMKKMKLADRDGISDHRSFSDDFALIARAAIDCRHWIHSFDDLGVPCDVVDLVDGRLFKTVIFAIQGQQSLRGLFTQHVMHDFDSFAGIGSYIVVFS